MDDAILQSSALPGIIDAVARHAAGVAPHECCGLVAEIDGRYAYLPCENVARPDPETRFMIAPEAWIEAEERGRVVMICHSHVGKPPLRVSRL
ncbi:MAG: Mov34/MPN/PAD-1 family protein [Candidatus Accumulibacter sp.]|jgi:proteasome lid subunit RPN8/RPN11|nr:Mov34/MPN/PAD-1 family protein [Accumulibacter sp.]